MRRSGLARRMGEACYICLEDDAREARRACLCNMVVHDDCLQRHLDTRDDDAPQCMVCRAPYKNVVVARPRKRILTWQDCWVFGLAYAAWVTTFVTSTFVALCSPPRHHAWALPVSVCISVFTLMCVLRRLEHRGRCLCCWTHSRASLQVV